jgi:hypothetical protein
MTHAKISSITKQVDTIDYKHPLKELKIAIGI